MGASRAAIFKWRSRGIPSEWKLKLISAPDAFTMHEIEQYEQARNSTNEAPAYTNGEAA